MLRFRPILASRHFLPLLLLTLADTVLWSRALFGGQALLPGAMLRGFAPFINGAPSSWDILRWDSLGQYYPWRFFGAQQLRHGLIPLWNPHQFAGTPFVANGQSAIFYPLNLPFWIFNVAWAFGFSAWMHTLLAACGTYFLTQNWKWSRAASLLSAVGFAFGGYLTAWTALPTLFQTAAWLPLLLLLLERATHDEAAQPRQKLAHAALPLALSCALLAGHAQIFFYCLVALVLRAAFLNLRAWRALLSAGAWCGALCAAQILPTLELARLGHRVGGPTVDGWRFLSQRALQPDDWMAAFIPNWPTTWGSFNENFPYLGAGVLLMSLVGFVWAMVALVGRDAAQTGLFCVVLTVFGLLYALATPLSQAFYFHVPGLSQMGGVGRALVLWNLGAALLAGAGLDALRRRIKTPILPAVALAMVGLELFSMSWSTQLFAPRQDIYPQTALTTWLQQHTRPDERILFLTRGETWLPAEANRAGDYHPLGVLPPNGAMVYGLNDVNGYDSLSLRAYREFVAQGQPQGISPQTNDNMILLQNADPSTMNALRVRYIVGVSGTPTPHESRLVFEADGAQVFERAAEPQVRTDGSVGWRDGQYQPQSFRLGMFIALCALGLGAATLSHRRRA